MRESKSDSYAKAGVDVTAGYESVERIIPHIKSTARPGVLGGFGGFGGFFQPDLAGMKRPVAVSGTDGVGTKLMIAKDLGIWNTVGIDCIAMNVNDTVCVNAEPVSFVDYIAIDVPNDTVTKEIGVGLQKGAEMSNMEIVGGEIAVLPEIVNCLDLSGTCLGFVEKGREITGEKCAEGDVIISLRSSGMHSNGFTLARKVLESCNVSMNDKMGGLTKKVGLELLTPTEIYVKQVLEITKTHDIHGLVNITGGGLKNIYRMKKGLKYIIDNPVKPAPIFKVIQELGNVEEYEMYKTFNMSMGFTIIAPEDDAENIVKKYKNANIVGRVEKGNGVLLEPSNVLYDSY